MYYLKNNIGLSFSRNPKMLTGGSQTVERGPWMNQMKDLNFKKIYLNCFSSRIKL